MKNPIKIFSNIFNIRKTIKKLRKNNKIFSHFTVEPYVIYLPFVNLFNKNFYYAIGTYSLELNEAKKTKILFWLAIKYINNVIYFSSYTKKKISNISFLNKKNGQVINPVIYPKKFKNYNFDKFNEITMVSVGMLKARKGYHNLIEVMNILINHKKKNFKLNIIGKSSNDEYNFLLKSKIKKYKLEESVKILTNVDSDNLSKIYKKSHLFILLSEDKKNHFEGFGIVYLEALSYNLPVIISNQTGATDLKKITQKIYFVDPKKYYEISNLICNHFQSFSTHNKKKEYLKILDFHNQIYDKKISDFYDKELN